MPNSNVPPSRETSNGSSSNSDRLPSLGYTGIKLNGITVATISYKDVSDQVSPGALKKVNDMLQKLMANPELISGLMASHKTEVWTKSNASKSPVADDAWDDVDEII